MANLDKKKAKIQERILLLENELSISLTKKTSTTKEIDVPGMMSKILALKKELVSMK